MHNTKYGLEMQKMSYMLLFTEKMEKRTRKYGSFFRFMEKKGTKFLLKNSLYYQKNG